MDDSNNTVAGRIMMDESRVIALLEQDKGLTLHYDCKHWSIHGKWGRHRQERKIAMELPLTSPLLRYCLNFASEIGSGAVTLHHDGHYWKFRWLPHSKVPVNSWSRQFHINDLDLEHPHVSAVADASNVRKVWGALQGCPECGSTWNGMGALHDQSANACQACRSRWGYPTKDNWHPEVRLA